MKLENVDWSDALEMQTFHLNSLILVREVQLNYPRLLWEEDKIMRLKAKYNTFKEWATNEKAI